MSIVGKKQWNTASSASHGTSPSIESYLNASDTLFLEIIYHLFLLPFTLKSVSVSDNLSRDKAHFFLNEPHSILTFVMFFKNKSQPALNPSNSPKNFSFLECKKIKNVLNPSFLHSSIANLMPLLSLLSSNKNGILTVGTCAMFLPSSLAHIVFENVKYVPAE